MVRPYSSFLLRCWYLDTGGWRIEIRHIQADRTERVSTLAAALEWVEARCLGAAVQPSTSTDVPGRWHEERAGDDGVSSI